MVTTLQLIVKARTVSINTNIEHIVLDEQEGIMSAAVENARVCYLHWKFEEISSFIGYHLTRKQH